MNADTLEQELRKALNSLPRAFWSEGWGARTERIKNRVGKLAPTTVTVYAHRCKYKKNGEFLFDMTWIVLNKEGYIAKVPLVLESEWKRGQEIHNDFQKLIVARADLRVMIFSAVNEDSADSEIRKIKKQVRQFTLGGPADRYLIAAFSEENGSFIFSSFRRRSLGD